MRIRFLVLPLLPALTLPFVSPAAPTDREELARALDEDCSIVLLIGDLAAASEGEGRQWIELVRDPEVLELAKSLIVLGSEEDSSPVDASEMEAVLPRITGLLGRVRAGALGIHDAEKEELRLLVEVDEGWLEQFAGAMHEDLPTTTDAQGRTRFEGPREESGSTLVGLQAGALVALASAGEVDEAEALCDALLRALDADSASAPHASWWTACDERCEDPLVEAFVDGRRMKDDELEAIQPVFGEPEVLYVGLGVGDGPAGEMRVRLQTKDAPVLDPLAQCFQDADLSLLRLAQEGSVGTVLGLEFETALETLVELAERATPGSRQQYEDGIQAVNALLGVDLEEEFFAELGGQVLLLRKVTDYEALASSAGSSDPGAALEEMPTIALTIQDEDVILAVLEPLVRMAAAQGLSCERRDVEDGEFWTIEPGLGVPLGLGVGSGFLVVGQEANALDLLTMARGAGPKGYLSTQRLAELGREFDGHLLSVAPVEESLASVESLGELVGQFASSEEEQRSILLLSRAAALARRHLSGLVCLSMEVESGISMRMLTR